MTGLQEFLPGIQQSKFCVSGCEEIEKVIRERKDAFHGFFGPFAEKALFEGKSPAGPTYTRVQGPEGPHRAYYINIARNANAVSNVTGLWDCHCHCFFVSSNGDDVLVYIRHPLFEILSIYAFLSCFFFS